MSSPVGHVCGPRHLCTDVRAAEGAVADCESNVTYRESVMYGGKRSGYIRNTPQLVSGIGALRAAENESASTRRVSCGAMMPSSQSRAVA